MLTGFAATAQAGHHRHHYYGEGSSLSQACRSAAAQGGPCGCVAEEKIFGTSAHILNGINLWMARAWLNFPRATPVPGMAAVWGTHHVEAVVAASGNTVTTEGPYGRRTVSLAAVKIVDPHGGTRYASRDARAAPHHYRRYASRHYGRGSYRVASAGMYSGIGFGNSN